MTSTMNQTELSGAELFSTLADCFISIGYPARYRIVEYCQNPKRFSDIVLDLRLNPASFKFHSKVLMDCTLLERVERGVYQTTELGKLLLQLGEKARNITKA